MFEKAEFGRRAADQAAIELRKQLHEAAAPRVTSATQQEDTASHVQYLRAQLQAQEQLVLEAQQMKDRYRSASQSQIHIIGTRLELQDGLRINAVLMEI